MAYDLGKIPAIEAHKQIIDHISRQLAACSEFTNNSLCYFGIGLKYKIEIELFSRGKSQLSLKGDREFGDRPTDEVVQSTLKQENAEVEVSHVEISDGVDAGMAKGGVRTSGQPGGKSGTRPTVDQHTANSGAATTQRTHGTGGHATGKVPANDR